MLVTGYTLYSSVYPVPPAPLKYLPYGVAAYLLVVLAVTLVAPHFLRRVSVVDRCHRRS